MSFVLGRKPALVDARLIFFKQPSVNAEQNIREKKLCGVVTKFSGLAVPGTLLWRIRVQSFRRLPVVPS